MKTRIAGCLALVAGLVLVLSTVQADDVKSGPDKTIAGAFNVKAITGAKAGETFCYVCKFNAESRPAESGRRCHRPAPSSPESIRRVSSLFPTSAVIATQKGCAAPSAVRT